MFGLLEGWWLFEDGREHALADERQWEQSLHASGFEWVDWSKSLSAESNILRIITASPHKLALESTISRLLLGSNDKVNGSGGHDARKEAVAFKEIGGLHLLADIYYPPEAVELGRELPVGQ